MARVSSHGLQGTPGLEPLLMIVDDYSKAVASAFGCLPMLQPVEQDPMLWLQRFQSCLSHTGHHKAEQLCWLPCGTCFYECHVMASSSCVMHVCLFSCIAQAICHKQPHSSLKVLQCSTTGQRPVQTGWTLDESSAATAEHSAAFPSRASAAALD